jgi:hypothetical protein
LALSSGGAISIAQAGAANAGALSAADWTRFDAKVSAVAGGTGLAITGTSQTPTLAVIYGASVGTAVVGNDSRLSDARVPLAGSTNYVQNGTTSQNAALNITGAGTFGSLNVSGSGTFGSVTATGSISGASFSGAGSGLTQLNAGNLSTGSISDARLSSNVALLSGTNTFAGVNSFGGLVLPRASSLPATPTAGQVYFDTASNTSKYFDGVAWKTVAVASTFGLYTATGVNLAAGGTVSIPSFTTLPTVTVWGQTAAPQWNNVTGNSLYPVTFNGGTVTVTNGSGGIVTLALIAAGQ